MYKKCKVVMLPTNQKSNVWFTGGKVFLAYSKTLVNANTNQHLYILSDDEIKEGDYVQTFKSIPNNEMCIHHCKDYGDVLSAKELNCKKIIASTDSPLLIKDNTNFGNWAIPSIPQSFIDLYVSEYNKGNKIEEVMVEYDSSDDNMDEYVSMFGGNEIGDTLNINPDNTISIKLVKTSWTRDKVIEVAWQAYRASNTVFNDEESLRIEFNEWVEFNL